MEEENGSQKEHFPQLDSISAQAHQQPLSMTGEFIPPVVLREPRRSPSNTVSRTLRRMSRTFEESDLPGGFFAATGSIASSMISVSGRRSSATTPDVDSRTTKAHVMTGERDNAAHPVSRPPLLSLTESQPQQPSTATQLPDVAAGDKAKINADLADDFHRHSPSPLTAPGNGDGRTRSDALVGSGEGLRTVAGPCENGYHFPPSHSFGESFRLGVVAFWHYCLTPLGLFVVVYGLNVVAWGGMLFLLLCNAAPAMCSPSCNDINSPRRRWIEYDSQIVNALFCVTGFGLAPWRFRDLYFLLQYRLLGQITGLRRLAGIHRSWFRLQGSRALAPDVGPKNVTDHAFGDSPACVPYPETAIPDAPLTGIRSPPTNVWKLDFMIWANVANTCLQCVLSGFMWGMNRYTRPGWAVGLFVGLAVIAAAAGGLVMFFEAKAVKRREGIPVSKKDQQRLTRDKELGIPHYNNIKDKKPKVKKK